MGRPAGKSKARLLKELIAERAIRVEAAMSFGGITKKEIAKKAQITLSELDSLFFGHKLLYEQYRMRHKNLSDKAIDNIMEIVSDPEHPQHYQASKYIHSTYKADFDKNLEDRKSDEIDIEITNEQGNRPAVIRIGKK